MNPENELKRSFTPMTEKQISVGLAALQEMSQEAMPKEQREHLTSSIKSLKALQKIRAYQKKQAQAKDG